MTVALPPLAAFAAAVATLFVAHLIRTIRWRVMLEYTGIRVTNLQPLASLSTGYIVNAVLPFRVGEIVRGMFLAYGAKANLMSVFASIAFERTLDLLVVAALTALVFQGQAGWGLVAAPALFGILAFVAALLVRRAAMVRVVVWRLASVFNSDAQTAILHFVDTFAELCFARATVGNVRFWALTVAMWAVYMASLILFTGAVGSGFLEEFANIYYAPLGGSTALGWVLGDPQSIALILYLTLPLVLALIYAALAGFNVVLRFRQALNWASRAESFVVAPAAHRSDRFKSLENYGAFLERRFRGNGGMLLEFEERGIGAALLHRLFHGGSGAVTALIELDGHLRVRKFATGAIGLKLEAQRDWIDAYKNSLPLVEVIGGSSQGGDHAYDMAYIGGTRDLYEAVHTEPVATSSAILGDVIDRMDGFHRKFPLPEAGDSEVRSYVAEKVCRNLATIEAALPEYFEMPAFDLNGNTFSTTSLSAFRQPDWLSGKFLERRQAIIHGDLTIENIMVMPGAGGHDWFLIDPNPGNILESPFIDFAKLLQSLHLGYEAIHREPRHSFAGGRFAVSIHRSVQYNTLFEFVLETLRARFGDSGVQQILLHEIVNYLRLIPHQLARSRSAGATFFGCLCILVREYRERYPGDMP